MINTLNFTYVDPKTLLPNNWNPNQMSPEAGQKLRASIEQNGHIKPVLVRELDDGIFEIVGGEHRVAISIDLEMDTIPVLSLGKISDADAKKVLILDNSRYGEDDAGKLSDLLSDIGSLDDLAEWSSFSDEDLQLLMGPDSGGPDLDYLEDLDDLDALDDDEAPAKDLQTHQTMKFKIPVEDAEFVTEVINGIISMQKIADSDSAVKSGEALMWLTRNYSNGVDAEIADLELPDDQ